MSANSERPFSTLSALSALASTPRNDVAANWSRITGTFAVGGFTAPSMPTARAIGLVGDGIGPYVVQRARDAEGEPGLGLVTFDGEGHRHAPRIGTRVLGVDPRGGGDRDPRHRVAHLRQVDLRHPGIAGGEARLQVQRHLHLGLGPDVGRALVEQLGQRRHREPRPATR